MIYSIRVGGKNGAFGESFDMGMGRDGADKLFEYCESRYKLSGKQFEEIKKEYDYEGLAEMVKELGVEFEMYDDE